MTVGADFDCIVVGAGVVGLAIARETALRGLSTLVIERHGAIGSETSSRNSEVIHGGLYYPPGSLKARCCVEGRERLYRFAAGRGVAHRRCGKLIVAVNESQRAELEQLARRGAANGVEDLAWCDRADVARLEPALSAVAALNSPSTGVIDSHGLMLALLGEAEAHGSQLVLNTPVLAAHRESDRWIVVTGSGTEDRVTARYLVNAAGLDAVPMLERIEPYPAGHVPRAFYAKGSYFAYAASVPFSHLVYPVPEPGGLGVHLTLDLAGRARFGPDVEWVAQPDYAVDEGKRDRFADAIRRYWPGVDAARLQVDYAGVRPKLVGPDAPAADFVVEGPADHGVEGLVNLLGIESPGLTSALALASIAVDRLIAP